jgi:hypothetical protein
MTAAAIASSSAMIDFHGRVLRLTRSTCSDRSTCFPLCPRGSALHDYGVRLTLSAVGQARLMVPENQCQTEKHWGPGRDGLVPSADLIWA